jgi:DedD protein
MDEQTRYRVTGSLFLLALAIICLPMLFDGEGIPSVGLAPLPAPPPAPKVEPLEQIAPASDYAERVETLRDQVDDDGFDVETQTRFGEPVLSEPSADTSAWAVQVASFVDQDNARKFRARLREQGFEAFISTTKADAELHHRVAVGPLLNQADAIAMREELSGLLDVKARVMAFSI